MEKIVKIKICGITNLEDASAAAKLGADAVGFVFYEGSPRYIPLEEAAEISRALPPFVSRVGVFVNVEKEKIVETAQLAGLDYFQFHGDEGSRYCSFFGRRAIKAFRVSSPEDINKMQNYPSVKNVLIDSKVEGAYGGSGKTFDWKMLRNRKELEGKYVILSGGLNEDNVASAIKEVLPAAVDVSSSIEEEPGKKDHEKMKAFIRSVRDLRD